MPVLAGTNLEFSEKGPLPTEDILAKLRATLADVRIALDALDPSTLGSTWRVQGREETGVGILVHVVEHFSYHTGQITLAVKTRKAVDMQYYEGEDLNITD